MKDFLQKRNLQILVATFFAIAGKASAIWAGTITENFEDIVLVDANGDPLTDDWAFGYGLSNGWKIIDGTIFGTPGAAEYGLMDTGQNGKAIEASYSARNESFIAIPTRLMGTLTFQAAGVASSVDGSIRVYELEQDGESYRKVSTLQTFSTTKFDKGAHSHVWKQYEVDLGYSGKLVGIEMVRSVLDNLSCNTFEEGVAVKALSIIDFRTTTDAVTTDTQGLYWASFTVTTRNNGTTDVTAADNATLSLLNANKQVMVTSKPVEVAAGQTADVTMSHRGGVNVDGKHTFYVRDNSTNKLFNKTAIVNVRLFGPRFAIDMDEGTPLDFGLATKGEEVLRSITITNEGNYTLDVKTYAPEGFSAEDLKINAGTSATMVIGMDTSIPGMKGGTLTLSLNAVNTQSFSLPLTGYVTDKDQMTVNFDDNRLPKGWEQGETAWILEQGMAIGIYDVKTHKNSEMTTTPLAVAEGEGMVIMARSEGLWPEFSVWYSTDNGNTWKERELDDKLTSDIQPIVLGDLPAGTYRLKFEGYHVAIDAIHGFNVKQDMPLLRVTDAGNAVVSNGSAYDFGTITSNATITFTLTNTGTGSLCARMELEGQGFSIDKEEVTLESGENEDVAVTLATQPYGDKSARLTIHTDDGELVIGLSGKSRDPEIMDITFDNMQRPDGWTATPSNKWYWRYMDASYDYQGAANHYDGSAHGFLTSPLLIVNEGATLLFNAKKDSGTNYLKVDYSTDNRNWTEALDVADNLTTDWNLYEAILPTGKCYIRFEVQNVYIDNITGLRIAPDGMPTGINMTGNATAGKTVYNLHGQRVEQSRKGSLYLINGKKIIE